MDLRVQHLSRKQSDKADSPLKHCTMETNMLTDDAIVIEAADRASEIASWRRPPVC